MNWYNRSKLTKQAQPATNVMLAPGAKNPDWGRERRRRFLQTFDVGQHLPLQVRLDNMEKAINTILSANLPIENEQLTKTFSNISKGYVVNTKGQFKKVQEPPKSVSDIFAAARIDNGQVKILYSETTGMSNFGKGIWSVLGWLPRPFSKRQGIFWNTLQKSGIMQNIEDLLIQEWDVILAKSANLGIIAGYNSSEWDVNSTTVGRDITITPLNVAQDQPIQKQIPSPQSNEIQPPNPTTNESDLEKNELV